MSERNGVTVRDTNGVRGMDEPSKDRPDDGSGVTNGTSNHETASANGHHSETVNGMPNGAVNGATGLEKRETTNGHHADADAAAASLGSPLLDLPPELLDVVLAHVPPSQLLATVRALNHVLPYSVSRRWRWEHLVLSSPRQFYPLYRALARERDQRQAADGRDDVNGALGPRGGDELARTLCVECWKGDVDMLNNVLRLLPRLRTLMLNVGTNFAPEHLEDMFAAPRQDLTRLELRFRPYVEEANYFQFLKGSYFDKAIHTLKTWPEVESFKYLSLVQDLLPRRHLPIPRTRVGKDKDTPDSEPENGDAEGDEGEGEGETGLEEGMESLSVENSEPATPIRGTPGTVTPRLSASASGAQTPVSKDTGYTGHGLFPYLSDKLAWAKPRTFAQPIVFFDVRCIASFGCSPAAAHLTHFRLRVPSRDIAYVLVTRPDGATTPPFPSLQYLDLSTTNVRLDAVLSSLLRTFDQLEHIVLDRTNLFGFKGRERGELLSRELGGLVVSVALHRSKEREKALAAWDTRQRTSEYLRAEAARQTQQSQTAQRGLSAAERAELELAREAEEEAERQASYARARRGHRSAGQATVSLRTNSRRNQALAAANAPGVRASDLPPSNRAWFVLPAIPRMKSVSAGGEAAGVSKSYDLEKWQHAFREGWTEAVGRNIGWSKANLDRYVRAMKKVAEWQAHVGSLEKGKDRGKKKAQSAKIQPPLDVRLFRYPVLGEEVPKHKGGVEEEGEEAALEGLIQIDEAQALDFLARYKDYLGDCERLDAFPCTYCLTPDCEGPYRRGAEGERVDGRGGMDAPHQPGCGHMLGRKIWGWEGVE